MSGTPLRNGITYPTVESVDGLTRVPIGTGLFYYPIRTEFYDELFCVPAHLMEAGKSYHGWIVIVDWKDGVPAVRSIHPPL